MAQAQAAATDRADAGTPANTRPSGVLALVPGPHDGPGDTPTRPLPRVEGIGGDPLLAADLAGTAADRAGARRRKADQAEAGEPAPTAPVTARKRRRSYTLDGDDE